MEELNRRVGLLVEVLELQELTWKPIMEVLGQKVGNLVSGARDNLEGFGTTTAAIACGGYSNPPTSGRDSTESWNGSSWSQKQIIYLQYARILDRLLEALQRQD